MIGWILIGFLVVVLLIVAAILFNFIGLWIKAMITGAAVSIFNLVAMRLRGIPPSLIVNTRITAVRSGLSISTAQLESHFLAGGNIEHVVRALVAADRAGIPLTFNRACAIDLATIGTGKSVFEAVRTSVNPKVIDCPFQTGGGPTHIAGVAKDGITVKVKARVTVRTNLERFVGGATEETIVARVGEGIVTTIGMANTYKEVLEHPDRISKIVLQKGLDSGTAFEILSIDIAEVIIGDNVGAKLQAEQAEADKRVAQAKAEVRRAAAVALEQEMKAKVEEMKAKVVEAESQIPVAISEAFKKGYLGVMDYYRLRNIQADTQMRTSISAEGSSASPT
ncbi:flotillin-like protein FloA [Methylacidiphilum caldifontis]|uniref:Flotillin-like protein FloA n=1 Tax=Methylacidiphilum caldifontis TaxID=2795386 RepID=A0A4Y8PAZ0_9BACT|nr:flotillin-like protein FloA [Methylacidiphilum caldifontis]QSR88103.1 flotillin-like protein FloA [Methylacidiphilum caldifontis]TFE68150.1 hypothetical protein A7Q10_00470 [Methylacidiphilum caldifontis]